MELFRLRTFSLISLQFPLFIFKTAQALKNTKTLPGSAATYDNVVVFLFRDIEARVPFNKDDASICDLLYFLDDATLLIVQIVQLARFLENVLAKAQKVDIVADVEVFRLDLDGFRSDRSVFDPTFRQQD